MKVAFISLGCAKNLVNTEQMMARVRDAGHVLMSDPDGADIAVLNTCGFIDTAKSEAIDHILALAELKSAGRLGGIVVAGCLSQRYQDEIFAELPEVDALLGTGSYDQIIPTLQAVAEGSRAARFDDIDAADEEGERILTTGPATAYLKIAEGCDNRCAYCVIPSLRGRYRSRPMQSILAEAKQLAAGGVQELIVIAQDITRYGTDLYGRRALPELLTALCGLDFPWIRLHYLYPDEIDDALIAVLAAEEKILPYLDIPIQHINDGVLKAMNRRGDKAYLTDLFARLRAAIPGLVLRTSIICGLPGEGEAEFEELCEFLAEQRIERAGVFPYSPEEGTPAAAMPNHADDETVRRRVELLIDLQSRVMDDFHAHRLGETVTVLCEGFDPEEGCYAGRSYAESPDIDGRILFTAAGRIPAGRLVPVRLTGVADGVVQGEIDD